jgi:hypothetical protein
MFYRGTKLFIQEKEKDYNNLKLVDDSSLEEKLYTKRVDILRKEKNYVVEYDYTCTNLSSLLLSKSNWGYDSNKKVHYLSTKATSFPLSYRKVTKVSKNAIWLENISYPFVIPSFLIDTENIPNLWVGVVYIDYSWHLYNFSSFYIKKDRIKL